MIKRYAVSIGGRVVAALLQVVIVGLFGRNLGVSDFGVFAASMSLTLGFMSFLELGMGARVLRGTSDADGRRALSTFGVVRSGVLLGVPVAALCWSALAGLPPIVVVVAAVYAAGEATGDLAVGVLQGERKSGRAMAVLLTRRGAVLSVLLLSPTASGVVFAAVAGGLLGAAAFLWLVIVKWVRPGGLFKLVRENMGIIASGGASSLSQLDVVVVSTFVGVYSAGLYASAQRLFNPINMAVTTMLQVVVPEIASQTDFERRIRVFRRARVWALLLAGTVAALSFLAPQIVVLIFGPEFVEAGPIASAVFVAAALSAVAQVHLAWMYTTHIPASVPIGMWVAVVLGLAGLAVFGLAFGVVGLAIGIIMLQALTMFAVVVPCLRQIRGMQS